MFQSEGLLAKRILWERKRKGRGKGQTGYVRVERVVTLVAHGEQNAAAGHAEARAAASGGKKLSLLELPASCPRGLAPVNSR